MQKRNRSPNYPALSLPDAVQRIGQAHKNQQQNGVPREVAAKSLGFSSLNGTSGTAISALIKYGLLEGRGDTVRVSDRAIQILHPTSPMERAVALRDAANAPALFKELNERFPGSIPPDNVIRNHLIRNGFAANAISSVIQAYRETSEFVGRKLTCGDSISETEEPGDRSKETLHQQVASQQRSQNPPPSWVEGKFRGSVDEEFRVTVTAIRLDRRGVNNLIKWLEANAALAPEEEENEVDLLSRR